MLCQECGERQATLHFTKIVGGQKTEFHICEACAKEKGEMVPGGNHSFSIHNLLSGLLNFDTPGGSVNQHYTKDLRCTQCNLTYAQFSKSGRFGCAGCYQSFRNQLEPLFRKVHGSNAVHQGKIPRRSGGKIQMRKQLQQLRQELQHAIEREEFEKAAELRDQIRDMDSQFYSG